MEDFSPPDMLREFFEWVNRELDALHQKFDALVALAANPAPPSEPSAPSGSSDAQENAGG